MNLVTALAIVIGVLGAVATFLFLSPLAGLGLQIWACFIAWASFFHCGGGEAGLKASVPANVWGSLCATIALILVGKIGGGVPVVAVIVGVTVAVMILGAHVPVFAAIPAAVYGYASTAAFGLLVAGADPLSAGIATSHIGHHPSHALEPRRAGTSSTASKPTTSQHRSSRSRAGSGRCPGRYGAKTAGVGDQVGMVAAPSVGRRRLDRRHLRSCDAHSVARGGRFIGDPTRWVLAASRHTNAPGRP